MLVTFKETTMSDPKPLPEYVEHTDGNNHSYLSPENRKEIEVVKDRIRAGDREGVNRDTNEAINRIKEAL